MSNPKAKGRPRLQKGKNAVRVSVSLPSWLARRLRAENLPASRVIALALIEYLTAHRKRS